MAVCREDAEPTSDFCGFLPASYQLSISELRLRTGSVAAAGNHPCMRAVRESQGYRPFDGECDRKPFWRFESHGSVDMMLSLKRPRVM